MSRHVVRSISLVRQGPLVELQLDQGERIRIHQRRVAAQGLRVGSGLTEAQLAALGRDAEVDRCEQRALRLLTVRARSAAELGDRLRGWGLDRAEAGSVVDRLERLGLVDDVALAQRTAARPERPGGTATCEWPAISTVCRWRRGFARPASTTTRSPTSSGARRVAEQRFGPPPYDAEVKRRAAGLLARRGFDEETVMGRLSAPPTGSEKRAVCGAMQAGSPSADCNADCG